MIQCSNCPDIFTKGKVCLRCGKAYCEKETFLKCPFCESQLKDAQIVKEKLGETMVEWFTFGTSMIGLVNFKEIPSFLLRFLGSSSFTSVGDYRLVLFPTKESSWKISNYFRKKAGMPEVKYDRIFEKSRYGIAEDPETKSHYLFLNLKAASDDNVEFLVSFLTDLFSEMDVLRQIDHKIVQEALAEALYDHVRKMGVPFIVIDEETKQYFEILLDNLPGIYAEYLALKKSSKVSLKEIPEFLRHKVELLFSGIDYHSLKWLRGVYDILNAYIQIASLLALAQEFEPLKRYLDNFFYPVMNESKNKLEDFPDIAKSIDVIVKELSQKEVYTSYDSYLEHVSRVFKNVIGILRPRYLRIQEVGALFEIGRKCEEMMENGEKPYIPNIGTLEKFNELLLQVFQRQDLYPELRILAGQTLQSILVFKVWKENDYVAYLQGLDLVQKLAQLIVDSVSDIKERLGKIDSEHGVLGYQDACMALDAFAQFSYAMNDEEPASRLADFSKRIAQKYNVLPMKVIHDWKDFVETHDYDKLLAVYRSSSAINLSEHKYMAEYIATISHLASATLRKEDRKKAFEKAEKYALAIMEQAPPTHMLMSYREHAVLSSLAMYHLVCLFQHITEANEPDPVDQISTLKEALLDSQAMSQNLAKIDPLNNFALKTEILYFLAAGELARTQEVCKRLKERTSSATLIKRFVNNVENWLLESEKLEGRRFLIGLELDISEFDPWENLFRKIIITEMNKDLEENIAAADAILLVEGPSDAEILEQFAKRLVPCKKILFMGVEGFTNMKYYSEAQVAKSLKIPLFIVFDGDTSTIEKKKRVKDKLIRQISLPQNHVITLTKNSIEDYLLVPTAIKRAFPSISNSVEDIEGFLKWRETKRDKRKVLKDLFNQLGLTKYDHKEATRIASKMKASEIDEEIKKILDSIK
jgi:hypothetical protein